jgi:EF hand
MERKPLLAVSGMVTAGLMGLALLVQQAGAQGTESSDLLENPPSFSQVDTNKDGFVTAEEAVVVPGLAGQLTALDVNADGKISEEEYAKYAVPPTIAPEELVK